MKRSVRYYSTLTFAILSQDATSPRRHKSTPTSLPIGCWVSAALLSRDPGERCASLDDLTLMILGDDTLACGCAAAYFPDLIVVLALNICGDSTDGLGEIYAGKPGHKFTPYSVAAYLGVAA